MPLNKTKEITGTIISILAIVLLILYLMVFRIGFDSELRLLLVLVILFVCSTGSAAVIFIRSRKKQHTLETEAFIEKERLMMTRI